MTRIYNDPADFAEEALAGFAALYHDHVKPVTGGVVRRHPGARGKVSVIFGGGSGHYPAFAGLVGPGFGDGAVVGNIFTSPSSQYAYSVARQANRGGGVIFSYGNYAGDVMNFGLASELLRADGIDARNVIVTDDILSASVEERSKRRGIAGDFVVFKVLAAAAETGAHIDEVERLGVKANDRTRTVGVAFSGCTFPGAAEPLFSVEKNSVAVGLGIHGEPGLETIDHIPARDLAKLLVTKLVAEAPGDGGKRVGVILNGLGSSKYEELFVLWAEILPLVAELELEIIQPEVGELVTSLDMAGVSLTFVWLDDELEPLWRAPVDSPGYRKGSTLAHSADDSIDEIDELDASDEAVPVATEASQLQAATATDLFTSALAAIRDNESELARIDAVAGDGDHGRGMVRGLEAAAEEAARVQGLGGGLGTVLSRAGDAWAAHAGGTSGVLWGSALRGAGSVFGDGGEVALSDISEAVVAFADTLSRLGKAQQGDKTMLDAVYPFRDAFVAAIESGSPLADAASVAADAADRGAQASAELMPKVGRARPHAAKSLGTPDPGAVSFAIIAQILAGHASVENADR